MAYFDNVDARIIQGRDYLFYILARILVRNGMAPVSQAGIGKK